MLVLVFPDMGYLFQTEQILDACKSDFVNNPLVLVPSVVKGQGTGHLHRCLTAALETKGSVFSDIKRLYDIACLCVLAAGRRQRVRRHRRAGFQAVQRYSGEFADRPEEQHAAKRG